MKPSVKTITTIIISLVVGIAIGIFEMPQSRRINADSDTNATKITDVLRLINSNYVDKLSIDSLTDQTITSLLAQLDPHSVYLTAAQVRKESEGLNGNFEGIGVMFRIVEDTIVVIQPVKGGPSAKAGIMPGDRIVKINDTLRAGIKIENDDVMSLLKGKKKTKVKLSIKRNGLDKLIDFVIARDVIKTNSVEYYGMLDKTTGYIKLTEFSSTSHDEVFKALSALKYDNDMQQLIFDIRGNGGGYLQEAVAIADEFLPKGDLIVFTKGRNNTKDKSYATAGGLFEKGKLIVLIDEISASASEILAGAIQDNDRGKIIGRRTFGKGLVQEQVPLPDGSAIRLTISRYYTPSGRCIQRPYTSNDPEQYYADFIARYANMENDADTIAHVDSLRYKTKGGRFVYGGGGIEPDIELSYHAYKRSEVYTDLLRFGLIYKYCFDYADNHRKDFSAYANGEQFLASFAISNELYNKFLAFAAKNNIKPKQLSDKETIEIKTLMKAYIAQILFDDKTFYSLFTSVDEDIRHALRNF
ncbi:MAG: S41 family peptidase [Bacteroidales bacterium]|jgi:carboxyl-terminal processing protease|nr:S41 family peptidase [Bacteroidales bacterium]